MRRITEIQDSTEYTKLCKWYAKHYSPKVSTTGNRFTIAFFLAIRITPNAKVTVTTMGRPSGIAATARLNVKKILKSMSEICFLL